MSSGTLAIGQVIFYNGPTKDYPTAKLERGDQGTLVRVEAKTDEAGKPYNAFIVSMSKGFEAIEPAPQWKDEADYQESRMWRLILWSGLGLAALGGAIWFFKRGGKK